MPRSTESRTYDPRRPIVTFDGKLVALTPIERSSSRARVARRPSPRAPSTGRHGASFDVLLADDRPLEAERLATWDRVLGADDSVPVAVKITA